MAFFENFTFTFIVCCARVLAEFSRGFIEEVTCNITLTSSDFYNLKFSSSEIPKNYLLLNSTSKIITSKIMQSKLLDLIINATPNLLI